ncbi:hypothetical protein ACFMQL_26535 [Nonomuraea fastidiosa]
MATEIEPDVLRTTTSVKVPPTSTPIVMPIRVRDVPEQVLVCIVVY